MATRHVTISAHNGAHARPVAELARLVLAQGRSVLLRTAEGMQADLGSVLAVMDLGLAEGDTVVLETTDSPGADALLATLAAVLDPRPT